MKYVFLDFTGSVSKNDVQDVIVNSSIGTPKGYGRNLDAFYDVLTSLKEDVIIDVLGVSSADEEVQPYLKKLEQLVADAATATAGLNSGRVIPVEPVDD
ncbi:MAG: barstar family protein [Saccharofermentans sp.]|nr:barstar family protein [Saccharofermentans sp.]